MDSVNDTTGTSEPNPTATPLAAATATNVGLTARIGVTIRPATMADVAFIDRLQKAHSKELGFLPTKAIEGKITLGQVLVAEAAGSGRQAAGSDEAQMAPTSFLPPAAGCLPPAPIGYLIAADRYSKRDEVGYITQINVLPEYRRSLVAAALLQAQFDRSAYGCRLYSCWCAQDLAANEFWEAMGFTPIAFRTGSRTKGKSKSGKSEPRIHIFWQKRVRADDTVTPWWYPAKTEGGEMREDRLVFPIPPGVHWRDVLPVVLPESTIVDEPTQIDPAVEAKIAAATARLAELKALRSKPKPPAIPVRPPGVPKGGLWFAEPVGEPVPTEEEIAAQEAAVAEAKAELKAATKAATSPKKVNPRLLEMARELRDRWSEQSEAILALPAKHDIRRAIGMTTPRVTVEPMKLLTAA